VIIESIDGDTGKRNGSASGSRLRRAEVELAGNFHQDLRDTDATMEKVEVLCAQPEHLADPQSAERAEHDEAAIALVDGIGERTDLSGSEEASLLAFDSREAYPVARRSGNPPGGDRSGHYLPH
jgi:hypothetical protein